MATDFEDNYRSSDDDEYSEHTSDEEPMEWELWHTAYEESTGRVYYYHEVSGEVSWEKPECWNSETGNNADIAPKLRDSASILSFEDGVEGYSDEDEDFESTEDEEGNDANSFDDIGNGDSDQEERSSQEHDSNSFDDVQNNAHSQREEEGFEVEEHRIDINERIFKDNVGALSDENRSDSSRRNTTEAEISEWLREHPASEDVVSSVNADPISQCFAETVQVAEVNIMEPSIVVARSQEPTTILDSSELCHVKPEENPHDNNGQEVKEADPVVEESPSTTQIEPPSPSISLVSSSSLTTVTTSRTKSPVKAAISTMMSTMFVSKTVQPAQEDTSDSQNPMMPSPPRVSLEPQVVLRNQKKQGNYNRELINNDEDVEENVEEIKYEKVGALLALASAETDADPRGGSELRGSSVSTSLLEMPFHHHPVSPSTIKTIRSSPTNNDKLHQSTWTLRSLNQQTAEQAGEGGGGGGNNNGDNLLENLFPDGHFLSDHLGLHSSPVVLTPAAATTESRGGQQSSSMLHEDGDESSVRTKLSFDAEVDSANKTSVKLVSHSNKEKASSPISPPKVHQFNLSAPAIPGQVEEEEEILQQQSKAFIQTKGLRKQRAYDSKDYDNQILKLNKVIFDLEQQLSTSMNSDANLKEKLERIETLLIEERLKFENELNDLRSNLLTYSKSVDELRNKNNDLEFKLEQNKNEFIRMKSWYELEMETVTRNAIKKTENEQLQKMQDKINQVKQYERNNANLQFKKYTSQLGEAEHKQQQLLRHMQEKDQEIESLRNQLSDAANVSRSFSHNEENTPLSFNNLKIRAQDVASNSHQLPFTSKQNRISTNKINIKRFPFESGGGEQSLSPVPPSRIRYSGGSGSHAFAVSFQENSDRTGQHHNLFQNNEDDVGKTSSKLSKKNDVIRRNEVNRPTSAFQSPPGKSFVSHPSQESPNILNLQITKNSGCQLSEQQQQPPQPSQQPQQPSQQQQQQPSQQQYQQPPQQPQPQTQQPPQQPSQQQQQQPSQQQYQQSPQQPSQQQQHQQPPQQSQQQQQQPSQQQYQQPSQQQYQQPSQQQYQQPSQQPSQQQQQTLRQQRPLDDGIQPQDRIGNTPFATDQNTKFIQEATSVLEKQLLDLNMEKSNLDSEQNRLIDRGNRTIRDRQRLSDVNNRMSEIEAESVVLRTKIKQAPCLVG